MAARFWRAVLAGEALIAAAVAWLWSSSADLSVAQALLIGCLGFVVLQFLWIAASWVVAARTAPHRWQLRDSPHVLRALAFEPLHFALAKFAMSADSRAPSVETQAGASGTRPVLLIHGILCNRAIWHALRARLAVAGFSPVRTLNLEPLHADMDTYRASAERELRALHREAQGATVSIVAHSMGGLVARALLRSTDSDLVRRIVTIATPHHGSTLARFLPLAAARQMRPQAAWLRGLNAEQEAKLPLPTITLFSREDALVAPAESALLAGAEAREARGLGHFGLLRAPRVLDWVVAALRGN